MKKLIYIVNTDWFFVSHRLSIALEAQKQNYQIHIITTYTDKFEYLKKLGFTLHDLNLDRKSKSVFAALSYFISISKLLIKIKPDIVHLITIKPLLLAGLSARLLNFIGLISLKGIVVAITGFGSVFSKKDFNFQRFLILLFFKFTYCNSKDIKLIFQNNDDIKTLGRFLELKKSNLILIKGSGVDLKKYKISPLPDDSFRVIFAGRLLKSKGILDFIEASKYVKGCNFIIAGRYDPDSIDFVEPKLLEALIKESGIEFLGHKDNMHEVLPLMSLIVLPSFYREGLPKILIEAAACGRPIITTNNAGCRDAIINGVSGILIPPRKPKILGATIQKFVNDREKCIEMGKKGRELAEKLFDINKVIETHLGCYEELYSK